MPPELPRNSRYQGLPTATHTNTDGRAVVYFTRRFVPGPEQMALLHEHRVQQTDRLDNLAARYFGDPELFWRLCDANRAMDPEALTAEPGRRLRITLPVGLSGPSHAS
jgi:hypothetical protein